MKYSGVAVLTLLAGLLYQGWIMLSENKRVIVSHAQESTAASKLATKLSVEKASSDRLEKVSSELDMLLGSMNQPPVPEKTTLIATKSSRVLTAAQIRAIRINTLRRHRVSMCYVSSQTRYAVVDGKFVREGDRLSGGVYVKNIEMGRVRLSLNGTSLWLQIKGMMKMKKKASLAEHGSHA